MNAADAEDFNEDIQELRTWGGEQHIMALCVLLKCNVLIVSDHYTLEKNLPPQLALLVKETNEQIIKEKASQSISVELAAKISAAAALSNSAIGSASRPGTSVGDASEPVAFPASDSDPSSDRMSLSSSLHAAAPPPASALPMEKKYCVTTAKRYIYPGSNFTIALCFLPELHHYHSCIRTGAYSYLKPEEVIVPLREQLYPHSVEVQIPLRHHLPKKEWDELNYDNEYFTKHTSDCVTYVRAGVFPPQPAPLKMSLAASAGNENDWEDGNGDNCNQDFMDDDIYSSSKSKNTHIESRQTLGEADEDEIEDFVPPISVPAMIKYYEKVELDYCGNLMEKDK
jgi:hypothetical protein